MTPRLRRSVLHTIERYGMIRPGDRIGIGISGGADSVALLRLFADLRPKLGMRCLVLHFNHQLRGKNSDGDERFVAKLAKQLDLEFVSDGADVAAACLHNRWNLEDGARRLRYGFFASTAKAWGLCRVAVAHTADDQAETVMAHLLRGTGLSGLAGIYPVAGIVIRPLLDVRRDDLRAYLLSLGQDWREDATNQDVSRVRARIRHSVLPLLESEFGGAIAPRLARMAALALDDESFWRALEDRLFNALAVREPGDAISIRIADLLAPMPGLGSSAFEAVPATAITRRLVRRIYSELRGTRQGLTAKHVEDVLRIATKSQSGSCLQLPGISVHRIFDRLWWSQNAKRSDRQETVPERDADIQFEYEIPFPGALQSISVVVPEIKRRFNLKVVDWPSVASETSSCCDIFDSDRLSWPLVLRNWRPGDAYRPKRCRSVRKLKRLLLAKRVPLSERAGWPVLTSAGSMVWAMKFPVAHEVAPHSKSVSGLMISEEEF